MLNFLVPVMFGMLAAYSAHIGEPGIAVLFLCAFIASVNDK